MAVIHTSRDLFRAGGKNSGPRFDVLKPGEVGIISRNGADEVVALSGGASTKETPSGLRGTWYRLPQGTAYDDTIFYLHNDYADHWSWEPARNMRLADFVAALAALNPEFIRV